VQLRGNEPDRISRRAGAPPHPPLRAESCPTCRRGTSVFVTALNVAALRPPPLRHGQGRTPGRRRDADLTARLEPRRARHRRR
jgi:hypothetical protein